jgi:PPK2 family polyphosphate:nucleotide phosphotransferase
MFEAVANPYLVPYDGGFRVADAPTTPPAGAPDKEDCRRRLEALVHELHALQRLLFAHRRHSLLLIFQAMDAGGKDSTIRAVMSGVNPAGCEVHAFERPTPEELDHDFLWRSTCKLPRRGRIGIFNRSYYEEVLVARVHPELIAAQRLPRLPAPHLLWNERLESILEHEKHLARNGTVILKFWLNVSKKAQRRRFLKRIDNPDKHWKFEAADIAERAHWDSYMHAYEEALRTTSRPWAPWYAIPADDKPFMRQQVAELIAETLKNLPLHHPATSAEQEQRIAEARRQLAAEE